MCGLEVERLPCLKKAEQDQLRSHLGWVTGSHWLEMKECGGVSWQEMDNILSTSLRHFATACGSLESARAVQPG